MPKKVSKKIAAENSVVFHVEGKMSTFGGPQDDGVGPDEGLALVEESEKSLYPPDFFLSPAQAGAPGLARRLNPRKFYVAARWPSSLTRGFLQQATARVANAAGTKVKEARAVDRGPALRTHRAVDLSPGLAKALSLETNDVCSLTIEGSVEAAGAFFAGAGVAAAGAGDHVIQFRRRQAHAFRHGRVRHGEQMRIRNIVLHSSDGRETGDLDTLTGDDVSAHWYVTRDGRIFHLVNDEDTAFHAGRTFKPRFFSNEATVGIEQEHFDPDPPRRPHNEDWPAAQVETVARLVAFLCQEHGLMPPDDIKTHAKIAFPAGRKQDPFGYPFDQFFGLLNGNLRFEWRAEEI
jgi:N-acetylmuramoyl-L-alanine amidase